MCDICGRHTSVTQKNVRSVWRGDMKQVSQKSQINQMLQTQHVKRSHLTATWQSCFHCKLPVNTSVPLSSLARSKMLVTKLKYYSSWLNLTLQRRSRRGQHIVNHIRRNRSVNRYSTKSQVYLVPSSPSSIVSPHQRLVVVVLFGQVVVKDTVCNTLKQGIS